MGVKVYPREQPFMTCLPPFSIQLCGWVSRPIYWILGIDNDNRTCEKKRKRKRARTQPAGRALAPEPLSPLLALTLSGKKEKGELKFGKKGKKIGLGFFWGSF